MVQNLCLNEGNNECPGHKKDFALSLKTPITGESREIQSDLKTGLSQTIETQENYMKLLLIALLRKQSAPRLSAFELLYGGPIPQAQEKDPSDHLKWNNSVCPPGRRNHESSHRIW